MITGMARSISKSFVANKIIDEQKQDLMRYGLEIMISTLIGTLIILGLGILLKSMWFSLIFVAVLVPLRQYTGGYHADTYLYCNISLAVTYLSTYFICKIIPENLYLWLSVFAIISAFIVIGLFAPIDNPNKRLNKEKKNKFKIYSLVITIIISLVCLWLLAIKNKNAITVSMTLLAVIILLIIGKIKNRRYKDEG